MLGFALQSLCAYEMIRRVIEHFVQDIYRTVNAQQMLLVFIIIFLINIVIILLCLPQHHGNCIPPLGTVCPSPFLRVTSSLSPALAPGCKLLTMLSSFSQVTEKNPQVHWKAGMLACKSPSGREAACISKAELPWQKETWLYGPLGICPSQTDTPYLPSLIDPLGTHHQLHKHQMQENSILKLLRKPYQRVNDSPALRKRLIKGMFKLGTRKGTPWGEKKMRASSQKWQPVTNQWSIVASTLQMLGHTLFSTALGETEAQGANPRTQRGKTETEFVMDLLYPKISLFNCQFFIKMAPSCFQFKK